jgi:hypothetical protein
MQVTVSLRLNLAVMMTQVSQTNHQLPLQLPFLAPAAIEDDGGSWILQGPQSARGYRR